MANADKSFAGCFVLGMGFTFDDTDTKGVASSVAEMRRLFESDPRNADRVFPYIGGEEINTSPNHAHHRYVMNFESFPLERKLKGHSWYELKEETQRQQLREGLVAPDYPGPVAADWPDLLTIVREKVKPSRDLDNRENYSRLWWQFAARRPGLMRALADKKYVIAQCRISSWLSFVVLRPEVVFDITVNVFPVAEPMKAFAVLQSRTHEVWAQFFASSLEDRLRYTPSDCFETFPFPLGYESNAKLEQAGKTYYGFRADLMVRKNEGLTKTYNRFHDPNEDSPDIVRLRELHAAVDRAILDAYGWQDIQPVCEFIPEFDEEEDGDNGRPRKKKYRYKWPEAIYDEVLARLLELNRQRAEEERRAAEETEALDWDTGAGRRAKSARTGTARKNRTKITDTPLFVTTEEE